MRELLDIATWQALGEDTIRAIFGHHKQKARHDKEPDEGFDSKPNKREGGPQLKRPLTILRNSLRPPAQTIITWFDTHIRIVGCLGSF